MKYLRHYSLIFCFLGIILMGSGCPKTQNTTPEARATPSNNQTNNQSAFRAVPETESGLQYAWTIEGQRPLDILQTIGNGVAFFDINNDGNLDILCVAKKPGVFLGDGKGKFTDGSATLLPNGLTDHFLGCAVGDFNNDGFSDVYLSAYRGGRLLQNDSGKRFIDVTVPTKLPVQPWGTSCAFFDANLDGKLDLYIGNYVVFNEKSLRLCSDGTLSTSCGPRHYDPYKGVLYLQTNSGTFESTPLPSTSGKVLGVAIAPPYEGRLPQIALANDEMPGDLLVEGGDKWQNQGEISGTAYDGTGGLHGGMGADWGDVNGDGKLDLTVMTFQNEDKCLYLAQDGDALYNEQSQAWGMKPSYGLVAFGCKFLDYNNDGALDLLIANGHVQSNAAEINKGATYPQSLQLYQNQENKKYVDASSSLDAAARTPIVGRGLAIGDYDNDGKVDALAVNSEGKPVLLHNENKESGDWIGFTLEGKDKTNKDAYGAVIKIKINGKTILRHCHSDGSYLSASDKRIHIGLGSATAIKEVSITVLWPDKKEETFTGLTTGKYYSLIEGGKPQ
jgi:enediyne biosynthesis protein E4